MTEIKIVLNGSTIVEMPINSYKIQIAPLKPTDDLKIKINFMTIRNDVIFEADGTLRNLLVISEEEAEKVDCLPMPRADTPTLVTSMSLVNTSLSLADEIKQKPTFTSLADNSLSLADNSLSLADNSLSLADEIKQKPTSLADEWTRSVFTSLANNSASPANKQVSFAFTSPTNENTQIPKLKKYKTVQKIYTTFAFLCAKFRKFHVYVHGLLYFNIGGSLIRFKSLLVAEACQCKSNFHKLKNNEIIDLVSNYVDSICCYYFTPDMPNNYDCTCDSIAKAIDRYEATFKDDI